MGSLTFRTEAPIYYFAGLGFASVGVGLIFYARLPLYRQKRFFSLGLGALPEKRRPYCRWGYACALLGIALLGCFFLMRHFLARD